MKTTIELVGADPDKILAALAKAWKEHLERETGMEVRVWTTNIPAHTASTSDTAWSGTEGGAQNTRR